MYKFFRTVSVFTAIICFLSLPAFAGNRINTQVKVIHASTGAKHVDHGLAPLISELRSVFRYTSYRLIKTQSLHQTFSRSDHISLPGKRNMVITPISMNGRRIRYRINIVKNKRSVFQTQIQLRNNSSVTIGGPQFKNGVLVLNIHGSAN